MKENEPSAPAMSQQPPYAPYPQMAPMPGVFPTAPPSYDEAISNGSRTFPPPPPGFNAPYGPRVVPPPQPPPAPPSYAGHPQAPTTVLLQFGPNRAHVKCPACHADVLTRTETGPSCIAHLCCLLLALMQCYICSCLPYCMDSLQTVCHYCPNCNTYLGRYEP